MVGVRRLARPVAAPPAAPHGVSHLSVYAVVGVAEPQVNAAANAANARTFVRLGGPATLAPTAQGIPLSGAAHLVFLRGPCVSEGDRYSTWSLSNGDNLIYQLPASGVRGTDRRGWLSIVGGGTLSLASVFTRQIDADRWDAQLQTGSIAIVSWTAPGGG